MLVHVVDCATLEPGRDPISDIDAIEAELAAYGGLADRPRLVVLNKIDVPDARELAEIVRPTSRPAGCRSSRCPRSPARGCGADVRDGPIVVERPVLRAHAGGRRGS